MICPATKLSPEVVEASRREPVRIGALLAEVLARYGVSAVQSAAPQRRLHPMAAAWLGRQSLAALADA